MGLNVSEISNCEILKLKWLCVKIKGIAKLTKIDHTYSPVVLRRAKNENQRVYIYRIYIMVYL